MKSIRILGTGSYVPPKRLKNDDLVNMGLDTSDEWIRKRTGVVERRIADPEVTASDLGYEATLKALEAAGLSAEDIELIIFATITPDTCCPSAANWLQARLNAPQAVTFDVTAACSGFIFGLNIAEQYLKNQTFRRVLVVASEIMTRKTGRPVFSGATAPGLPCSPSGMQGPKSSRPICTPTVPTAGICCFPAAARKPRRFRMKVSIRACTFST